MLNFSNQPSNFTGVNIRKHKDPMSVERSNNKPIKVEHEGVRSSQQIVERIAHKTRTGFIPQMRKVNQDAYYYQKDLAGIPELWMIGVMDGHGVNGHQVSAFVK